MGTWGTGPFQNDAAMDWVVEFANGCPKKLTQRAFLMRTVKAKELVEKAPCSLGRIPKVEAKKARRLLEAAGADSVRGVFIRLKNV